MNVVWRKGVVGGVFCYGGDGVFGASVDATYGGVRGDDGWDVLLRKMREGGGEKMIGRCDDVDGG